MTPEFSLIIPTIRRVDELRRLLRSVRDQDLRTMHTEQVQVIVVDQNDDGRLDWVMPEFADSFRLEHVRIPARGTSNAKNEGLKRANGHFVAFPDDDCWYPPGLLEQVKRELEADAGRSAVFGAVEDPNRNEPLIRYPARPLSLSSPRDPRVFLGLLVAQFYPAAAVTSVREFDIRLGVGAPWGSGEETDFAIRVLRAGYGIRFLPSVKVWHPIVDHRNMPREKVIAYALGFGATCRKNGLWAHAAWKVIKPWMGAAVSLLRQDMERARYYWWTAWGRAKGFVRFSTPRPITTDH